MHHLCMEHAKGWFYVNEGACVRGCYGMSDYFVVGIGEREGYHFAMLAKFPSDSITSNYGTWYWLIK